MAHSGHARRNLGAVDGGRRRRLAGAVLRSRAGRGGATGGCGLRGSYYTARILELPTTHRRRRRPREAAAAGGGGGGDAEKIKVVYDAFEEEDESGRKLEDWVEARRIRPLPPAARDDFLGGLAPGAPFEMRFEDGWWQSTLIYVGAKGALPPILDAATLPVGEVAIGLDQTDWKVVEAAGAAGAAGRAAARVGVAGAAGRRRPAERARRRARCSWWRRSPRSTSTWSRRRARPACYGAGGATADRDLAGRAEAAPRGLDRPREAPRERRKGTTSEPAEAKRLQKQEEAEAKRAAKDEEKEARRRARFEEEETRRAAKEAEAEEKKRKREEKEAAQKKKAARDSTIAGLRDRFAVKAEKVGWSVGMACEAPLIGGGRDGEFGDSWYKGTLRAFWKEEALIEFSAPPSALPTAPRSRRRRAAEHRQQELGSCAGRRGRRRRRRRRRRRGRTRAARRQLAWVLVISLRQACRPTRRPSADRARRELPLELNFLGGWWRVKLLSVAGDAAARARPDPARARRGLARGGLQAGRLARQGGDRPEVKPGGWYHVTFDEPGVAPKNCARPRWSC